MSLTVVGSIAFDSVKTPFGERERMLGGSAVHFSLAASFFTEVRVVGPVGDDFGSEQFAVLEGRGVNTDDIERVPGGRTFFWQGHYDFDLNTAHTDETQLNVFGDFEPKLSEASRKAEMLFLANIQPDLQRQVRSQCGERRLRRARLDEPLDRDGEGLAAGGDRRGRLRDRQRRRDPRADRGAQPGQGGAGGDGAGPERGRRQAGRVRRGAVHRRRLLRPPGFPARGRPRPDRRRRQLRRRLPRLPGRLRGRDRRDARCGGRWDTGRCSPPSTSRSSGPSGSPG